MVDMHPYSMHAWQQELPAPQRIGVDTCCYSLPILVAQVGAAAGCLQPFTPDA
jgi:hypothetical protein